MRRSTWLPALSMMLVSTISYIDRNAIAVLIPTIQAETGLSGREYGQIVAAFSYAYMLGNPLWGMLLDRLGVRRGMMLAVAGWTVASAAHAFAGNLWSFGMLRTALGFFEGATFPGALRTVMQSLSPAERSRGIALSYSGGSLGAILTPFIVTPIALAFGWRAAFLATGVAGLAWLMWWWTLSSRPELKAVPARVAITETKQFHWLDRRVFAFIAAYSMGALPLGFILYMSGVYLSKQFQLSQGQLGGLLWIPPLGWECGYFFWGWWIDRSVRSGLSPTEACVWVFSAAVFLSLPLALAPQAENLAVLMAQLFFAMFVTGAFIVGGIAYATDAFGNARAGLIAGLGAGSFSALTAMTAPVFGGLFDQRRYAECFYIATAFPVAGYLLWQLFRGRAISPRPG